MSGDPIPSVRELIERRAGEEMALNDRYLNPQMGRILRTLGFDRTWTGGEGAHLIDSAGERYLDLFGGYGVFAIGRNHPAAIAAIEEVMAARTGNLPQLGVTLLSGVLAEQLLARAPDSRRGDGAREHRHRGGRGGDQDRARRHRAPARAVRRARLPRPDARLAVAEREREFREGFGPLLPGCERAVGRSRTRWSVRSRGRRGGDGADGSGVDGDGSGVETWRRSWSSPCRARASTCPPTATCSAPSGCAAKRARCSSATRSRPASGAPGGSSRCEHWDLEPDLICLAKALSGGLVPIGAVLVSRAAFDRVFDGMERAVRHGSTFGGNDLAAAAALATLRVLDEEGLIERAERLGALLLELTEPLVDRYEVVTRRARPRADVGDRVRPARRARSRAGCGTRSSAASPACSPSSSPSRCSTSTGSSARSRATA